MIAIQSGKHRHDNEQRSQPVLIPAETRFRGRGWSCVFHIHHYLRELVTSRKIGPVSTPHFPVIERGLKVRCDAAGGRYSGKEGPVTQSLSGPTDHPFASFSGTVGPLGRNILYVVPFPQGVALGWVNGCPFGAKQRRFGTFPARWGNSWPVGPKHIVCRSFPQGVALGWSNGCPFGAKQQRFETFSSLDASARRSLGDFAFPFRSLGTSNIVSFP